MFIPKASLFILVHPSRRLKCNIVITLCLSYVVNPSIVVYFPHCWLLSLKPQNVIWRNLTGSKNSTSSSKFFLLPIKKPIWPARSLIGLGIFRKLLLNRWIMCHETWQEGRTAYPLLSLCFSGSSRLWFADAYSRNSRSKYSMLWILGQSKNKENLPGRSVKKVAHYTQVHVQNVTLSFFESDFCLTCTHLNG